MPQRVRPGFGGLVGSLPVRLLRGLQSRMLARPVLFLILRVAWGKSGLGGFFLGGRGSYQVVLPTPELRLVSAPLVLVQSAPALLVRGSVADVCCRKVVP